LLNGLLGGWKLDEDAADGTAEDCIGSNNGVVSSLITQGATGKFGNACSFPGGLSNPDSTNGVIMGSDYSEFGTAGSISMWFTDESGNWRICALAGTMDEDFGENGGWRLWLWQNGSGQPILRFTPKDIDGNEQNVDGTTIITTGASNYHHILVTWDSDNINIYLDGDTTPEATASTTYLPASPTGYFRFGLEGNWQANRSHIGKIDDVYVWDRALPATAASTIFSEGIGKTHPF